jgi:hypothetical protein
MALRKNITLPANTVASYHRISGILIHDAERVCEIHLESYKDAETRLAVEETEEGGEPRPKWKPITTGVAQIRGAAFTLLFGPGVPEYPSKADLYAYLKTEPQFAGATDV